MSYNERIQQIASHLQGDLGLTPEQAAGVLGNFKREAGRDLATSRNEGGAMGLPTGRGGYGLAQWTGSRQQDLISFAGGREQAADLNTQLKFLSHELNTTERRALDSLRRARTPEEAAVVFDRDFERSGVKALDQRKAFARQSFDLIKGTNRAGEEGANITPQATPAVTPAVARPAAASAPKQDDGFMGAALAGIRALGGGGVEESAIKAQFAQGPEFATELNTLGDAIIDGGRKGGERREQAPRTDTGGSEMLALAAIRSLGGGAPQTQQEQPAPQLQQTQTPAAQPGGVRTIGRIAKPEEDVFPTTGPHLDVRIQRPDGSYINPEEGRSMLTEVQVGGKPLFSQGADGGWSPAAPITSRYGPRAAPAPGASTYHRGLDLGVGAGTELTYTGAGEITREHGMYVIKRPDGHRLKLLHTV